MKAVGAALCWGIAVVSAAAQSSTLPPSQDPIVVQGRIAMVIRQSTNLFDAGQYDAALKRLDALSGSLAKDPVALNLRGAILTKLGKFEEARRIFHEALAADPNSLPAAFNLGELDFMQNDYPAARAVFQSLLNRDPRNELLRLKLVACELLLGNETGAQGAASALIPAGQTPAWYYAQAMMAQKKGQPGAAKKYIASARAIYGADTCKLFDESIAPFDL